MKKSKYYIDRYKLNTQSQYFYRGNLSDEQLIKSASALTDVARKRLKSFKENKIDPMRYTNLERVYDKTFMRKRNDMTLSDTERRKYMYYLNELEEYMYERHMTVRETLKDYRRAINDYNEKLGLNLNNKQYLQLVKVIDLMKMIDPTVASEQLVDLAHQYNEATYKGHTIAPKKLLKLVDSFLEKQEKITRGKKHKAIVKIRGEFNEQYENLQRKQRKNKTHREVTKVSTGNTTQREKNRRFKR